MAAGSAATMRCVRQENQGVTAARNFGAAESATEYLLFLDDDMVVPPDFVRAHLDAQMAVGPAAISALYDQRADIRPEAVRAWYLAKTRGWTEAALAGIEETAPGLFRVPGQLLSSTNLGVRRQDFQAVGGFDLGYAAASCEDTDLGLRLARAGVPVYRIGASRAAHLEPRASFSDICRRQRRGAAETVRFVRRFADTCGTPQIASVNAPIALRVDSARTILRKSVKAVVAAPGIETLGFLLVELVARAAGDGPVTRRLCDAVVGAHLQRGWREGLHRHSAAPR
jgi:glycosyltransferase involved in cell wall biosynthesis